MTAAIGIDLGTTNSVITHLVDGQAVPIEVDGSAIVPSVVLLLDDRVVVGREARNLELLHPERTVRSAKRRMGTDHTYALGARSLRPEEIAAQVLGHLKAGAEKALGQPVKEAVITVPAYFDDAQRRATLRAGELAGLDVLRLLNEPTSASLVYDQVATAEGAEGVPELVLIYDLGGGTFDVSILEVFEGVREVRATAGNTHLGGDDFDEKVVGLLIDELRRTAQHDPREDPRAMARLRRAAEQAKIDLSSATQVRIQEEFLATAGGRTVNLDVPLTRRQLEEIIEPLLTETLVLCRKAVTDAGIEIGDLTRICLVGGSTRIPLVRRLLAEAFGADIHEEIDPDLAVGLGAAVQAGLLLGVPVERILVDVSAHSLGILVADQETLAYGREADTFAPIIPRNAVLPATRAEEFYTVIDEQKAIEFKVFQGESASASQNTAVGSFRFDLAPAPEHSPVRVEFAYDLNGVIQVEVEQVGRGRKLRVALSLAETSQGSTPAHQEKGALTAVERKAEQLLAQTEGEPRAALDRLLAAYRAAQDDEQRQQAEDDLLDFFVAFEDEDEDDEDEG